MKKTERQAQADTSEFVKIRYLIIGDEPTNGQFNNALKKVNEIMKKKINAELEWHWATWNERETQYYAKLVSGERFYAVASTTAFSIAGIGRRRRATTRQSPVLLQWASISNT